MNNSATKRMPVNQHHPIKVAHLIFSLEPGGLENGVVNISNRLDRAAFKTDIICLDRIGSFSGRLLPDVGVVCLSRGRGFSFSTVARLARQLREIRPDVIHTHNLGPLIYAVLARFLLFRAVPILHGEHCDLQEDEKQPRRIRQRRVLYRFCRRIHGVSAGLKDHLIGMGFPSDKISAIVNGVDSARFYPAVDRPQAKKSLGLESGAQVIGMVGRFIGRKRHLLMLEAFVIIAGDNADSVLLLIGDSGESKEEIISAIQSHPFRNRILWAGHQDDPAPYYRAMDLLVMPSSSEGLSNALLEAMASGVPSIAHPACGAAEVINDSVNGILRKIETPEELSAVVSGLLADPGRLSNLARQARETAEGKFSINCMVASYASLYREVSGHIDRMK